MRAELLQMAADLARKGEPFVLAVVVRRESYSSAHQGDMARDHRRRRLPRLAGRQLHPAHRQARGPPRPWPTGSRGWCRSRPSRAATHRPGVTALPMTCHSGGSVDVYLEPILPVPRLLVFGALAGGAGAGGARPRDGLPRWTWSTRPADRAAFPSADRILASPAAQEVGALATGRREPVRRGGHHGRAATRTRWRRPWRSSRPTWGWSRAASASRRSARRWSRAGIPAERLERIRNPAGLDLGARLPEEVALSILAEIVQVRPIAAGRELAQEAAR